MKFNFDYNYKIRHSLRKNKVEKHFKRPFLETLTIFAKTTLLKVSQRLLLPFIFLLSFWTPKVALAQQQFEPNKLSTDPFVIDGRLNEPEWEQAVPVSILHEIAPGNNTPAKVKTNGYIVYTATHLFIGFHAFTEPNTIRASIRPRDDFSLWSDDLVMVRLDTYADSRNNFLMVVNPLGSQFDVRSVNAIKEEDRYDISFNMDFETAGQIVSDGYQVEIKIPFSSLPFPNGKNQKWHFNLFRKYFDLGNEIELSSQTFDRDNSCEVCQTTDVLILSDITIEKRFELLPYVSGNVSGQKSALGEPMAYSKFNPNAGLGINLDLNKTSTLELTLNPDFSQVEADVTQIDINSSYALEYPERRPFFNRGTDIVDFTDGAFYSRSVNNPLISSKLISQGKKSRVYFLMAVDQNSPYLLAGEDRSYFGEAGQSFVNVFRYQHLLSNTTRMGIISTNRFYEKGGYGNLVGTDGRFILSKNWQFNYELFVNTNLEPTAGWIDSDDLILDKTAALDGEILNGGAYYLQLFHNTEHWQSALLFSSKSPHYQSNVGFVVKNNRRWTSLTQQYQNFANKKGLQFFSIGYKADLQHTPQGEFKTLSLDGIFQIRTYLNTSFSYTYDWDIKKDYLDRLYTNLGMHQINIRSTPAEYLTVFSVINIGKDIAYNAEVPDVGKQINFFIQPSIQLNNNFGVVPSIRYAQLRNENDNTFYYKGYIGRFTLRYQFTNFLSVRLISEYDHFNERFFTQPLIQWNPNPATVFYVGGNQNSLEEWNAMSLSPFRFDQTQFFLKFQYLIGL